MSGLKRLFIFYIHAHLHVALSAYCLTKITQIEFGSIDESLAFFVFSSTITSYNLLRFWKRKDITSGDADWLDSHKYSLLLLNALASFAILFFGASLQKETMFLLIPLILITLFYNLPFQYGSQSLQLRNIAGIKIFLVATVWSSVTVLLPLAELQSEMQSDQWITFVQRFLFIFAIAIPFEIRDLNLDKRHMRTIPQCLGIKNSKILGIFLLIVFFGLEFFKDGQIIYASLPLFLTSLVSIAFLLYSNNQRGKYYTSFWVESIPIFWYLLIRIVLI